MKTEIIQLRSRLHLVLLALTMTGCATPALWKHTASREWKPNAPDQVILVTDTNQHREVVVLFRQFTTRGKTLESRDVALPVSRSKCEVILSNDAIRELTNSVGECWRLPVYFDGHVPPESASRSSGYATWDPLEQQLMVHAPEVSPGPFNLPTSHQPQKTALRICGLPFAVATDAALVGAATLCVSFWIYAGTPGLH